MKLPKDLSFISLKYAGRCRSCATRLEAGELAHWSPSSKKVWCNDCVNSEGSSVQVASDNAAGRSRDTTTNASPGSSSESMPVANSTQTSWQQLCKCAQRCIEAEAAKSLVPYANDNPLWFLHPGEENLVVGQSDSTPAPGELSNKLRSRKRSIIYGWPDRRRNRPRSQTQGCPSFRCPGRSTTRLRQPVEASRYYGARVQSGHHSKRYLRPFGQ